MKTGKLHTILLTSASIVAVVGAASPSAQAQDASTNGPSIEEIIVTAQKRAQSQQDVPITLNAFSSSFLDTIGAENLRDISAYTPGLDIQGVTQPKFKIRGIETDDFGVGTDPAVGIFIDGVYASRSGAAVVFFSDIERIEVLKGPQGTLFGRNTAAGAISIHTHRPEIGVHDGRIQLRYGRFDKQQFDVMWNMPLSGAVAMRANLLVNKQDGYAEDAFTGEKYGGEFNVTGRVQLRWEPNERTAFNLAYEFDHTDQDEERPITSVANGSQRAPDGATTVGDLPGHGGFLAAIAPLFGLPITEDTPLDVLYAIPLGAIYGGFGAFGYTPANPSADWDFFSGPDSVGGANPLGPVESDLRGGEEKRDLDGITLNITHDFNWGTLTSISAYKKFTSNNLQDDDGTADVNFYLDTNNIEENESFYQELRLNGESGKLTWTLGASYYNEHAEQASAVHATTNSIDSTLYNLGVTPGILALQFDPTDGINGCESIYLDSLGGFISFNNLPLNCIDPSFAATPLNGLSLEDVSSLALTSFGGRLWGETMFGDGRFKAFAAFADASFAVNERFNIHAGLRYTHDSKSWQWFNEGREIENSSQLEIPGIGNLADIHQQLLAGIFQALVSPTANGDIVFDVGGLEGVPFKRKDTWDNLSPRIAMDYHFADDAMLYASYTRGYKAGGYNTVEVNSFFDNEKVWNIEAGIKSQWADNRIRFNMSVWKYKYNDKQSIRLVDVDTSSVPRYLTQTEDVSGKGLDVELLWVAAIGLRFFANGGYQDVTCTANCGLSAVGDPTGEPSTRISFGGDYSLPLSGGSTLAVHVDHSYSSAERENGECRANASCGTVTFGGAVWTTGDARHFTNARISWTDASDDLSISFFASNVFGNRYRGGAGGIGKDTLGAAVSRPSEPGVWGIDISKSF